MTSRERVLLALAGGRPDRVPFAEPFIESGVLHQMFGAEDAADPIFVADRLGLDLLAFRLMPPLFVEETVTESGRKHQTAGKLHSRDDLSLLETLEDPVDPNLYRGLEQLVSRNAGDRAIVGCSRLGISATLMSMDLTGFSYALADDPELVLIILRRYLQWAGVAADEMQKRGVDLLWFYDDMAYHSGPMMSPQVFREMILPEVKKLTSQLSLPWIFHSDGDLRPVLDELLSLGMSALHPIEPESMSLAEIKRTVGDRVCLVGNVAVDTLARGSEQDIFNEVKRCFRDAASGGYMITSSNSIPDYAKPQNVRAMARAIRHHNNID